MASKRLVRVVHGVALWDVLNEQLHLRPEEEISEDGKLGDWGHADERALRLEIFQFLRNLEAPNRQRCTFH
jgi:hypothetical protein